MRATLSRRAFTGHLEAHPFAPEMFLRFLDSIRRLASDVSEDDADVLHLR